MTLEDMETEYVMLRMRLGDGVDKQAYRSLFGFDFDSRYGGKLKNYVDSGFVISDGDSCRFTTDGMYVSNSILSTILDL